MGKFLRRYQRIKKKANRKANRMAENVRSTPMPKRPSGGVIGEGNMGNSIYLVEPSSMTPDKQTQADNLRKKKAEK